MAYFMKEQKYIYIDILFKNNFLKFVKFFFNEY